MSTNSVNYLISSSGLGLTDTGALKIFYDFSQYTSGDGNTYLDSVPSGNILHSGKLTLHKHTGDLVIDLSNDYSAVSLYSATTGLLQLYGHKINADTGLASYVEIQNTSTLFNGTGFTFVVEGGKFPRDAAGLTGQGAIHDREAIFSNISSSEPYNFSGWELGINSANLAYFKCGSPSGATIVTFDQQIPMGENIWAFRYDRRFFDVARFDPSDGGIYSRGAVLSKDLKNGESPWLIGAAENDPPTGIDTMAVSTISGASSLRLRNFLYFDQFISDDQLKTLASGLKGNLTLTTVETTGYITGITGFTSGLVVNSGLIYTTSVLTGYKSTTVTYSLPASVTPLYGTIEEHVGTDAFNFYGTIYEDCGQTGILQTVLLTGGAGETITGGNAITGYEITYPTDTKVVQTPLYYVSGVSGILSSGYKFTYGEGVTNVVTTGNTYVIDGVVYNNLYPRSVSYLGDRYAGDFVEIITGMAVYSGSQKMVNNIPSVYRSSYNDGMTLFTYYDKGALNNHLRLYLNGVAVRYGTGTAIKVDVNGTERDSFLLERDYLRTGYGGEIFSSLIYSGLDQMTNLWGVFDLSTTGYAIQQRLVSDTSEYGTGFAEIAPSGKDVFFNGVKIYEGNHYTVLGGKFVATGTITGMTGMYFAWPQINGTVYYTGSGAYDYHYTGNYYLPTDSTSLWINGIRQSPNTYVYHDIKVDLVSGVIYYLDGTGVIGSSLEV